MQKWIFIWVSGHSSMKCLIRYSLRYFIQKERHCASRRITTSAECLACSLFWMKFYLTPSLYCMLHINSYRVWWWCVAEFRNAAVRLPNCCQQQKFPRNSNVGKWIKMAERAGGRYCQNKSKHKCNSFFFFFRIWAAFGNRSNGSRTKWG